MKDVQEVQSELERRGSQATVLGSDSSRRGKTTVDLQPGKLVAGVVPANDLQEFLAWREQKEEPSIADAFKELRRICAEEGYEFEIPAREDRPNPFADDLP